MQSNLPKWYKLYELSKGKNLLDYMRIFEEKAQNREKLNSNDLCALNIISRNYLVKPKTFHILERLAKENLIDKTIFAEYKKRFQKMQDTTFYEPARSLSESVVEDIIKEVGYNNDGTRIYYDKDKNEIEVDIEPTKKFLREHFAPVEGCTINKDDEVKGADFCVAGGHEDVGYYKLIKPLKLKGTITFSNEAGCDCRESFETNAYFTSKEGYGRFTLSIDSKLNNSNAIYNKLPQWFKDGLLGEISFEADIELTNKEVETILNGHTDIKAKVGISYISDHCCGDDAYIYPKNIKLGKAIRTNIKDKKWYKGDYNISYHRLELDSKDAYVNVRESPNGKILTQIKTKDSDKIVLFNLSERLNEKCGYTAQQRMLGIYKKCKVESSEDSSEEDFEDSSEDSAESNNFWIKVLYFPPNVNDATKAIIGYIHSSQVKSYQWRDESDESDE